MPDQDDWVTKRTVAAKAAHPLVTIAVGARIESALRNDLQSDAMTAATRNALARELIAAMRSPQAPTGANA